MDLNYNVLFRKANVCYTDIYIEHNKMKHIGCLRAIRTFSWELDLNEPIHKTVPHGRDAHEFDARHVFARGNADVKPNLVEFFLMQILSAASTPYVYHLPLNVGITFQNYFRLCCATRIFA